MRLRSLVFCGITALALLALLAVEAPARDGFAPKEYRVRLYSGGSQVAEFLATGPGVSENGTYVFPVEKGVHRKGEVRISGTYSVEPVFE